jgi:hypothetical protein
MGRSHSSTTLLVAALLAGCAGVKTAVTPGQDGGGFDVPTGTDAPNDIPVVVTDGPSIDITVMPPTDAACTPVSCTPTGGAYCGTIGDGCHRSKDCGACAGAGQVCTANICVEGPSCVRGTCNGAGGARYCGKIGTGCGDAIDCGACPTGNTCSPDGVCVPANCTPIGCDIPGGAGKYCGRIGDGCGRTIDCTCAAPQTCGGTGINNVCGDPNCVPITCNPTGGGQYCGTIGNGCGKALDCPATCPGGVACPANHACPGGGTTCSGIQCQIGKDNCPATSQTTLTGTIYDPAGKNPLYNILVYVPNATPSAITSGATCDKCDTYVTGSPIAVALTDAQGRFSLKNVPSGTNIPVVIQTGKWRRQITVANVPACVSTALTDKNQTRLPRNKSEGDIPLIAIATGGSDAVECLVRSVGLDENEFTNDSGAGRIQLFQGYRASPTIMTGGASSALRAVDQLWATVTSMRKYDVVLMACEGDSGQSESRTAAQYAAVRGYGDIGGRIFGSHYHNNWVRSEDGTPSAGYPQVVKFASGAHGLDKARSLPAADRYLVPQGHGIPRLVGRRRRHADARHDRDHRRRAHRGLGDRAHPAVDLRSGHQPEPDQAGRRVLLVHDARRQRQRLRPHGVQRRPRLSGRRIERGGSLPHPLRRDTDRPDTAAKGAGVHAVRSVVVRADRNRNAGAASGSAAGIDPAAARRHAGAAGAAASAASAASAATRITGPPTAPSSWTAAIRNSTTGARLITYRTCAAVRLAADVRSLKLSRRSPTVWRADEDVVMQIESRPYGADAAADEIEALRARVWKVEDRLFVYDEVPVQSLFTLDLLFDRLEELAAGLDRFAYVVDLRGVKRPGAEVRERLKQRVNRLNPRLAHVAAVVGNKRGDPRGREAGGLRDRVPFVHVQRLRRRRTGGLSACAPLSNGSSSRSSSTSARSASADVRSPTK